jgi:hypothetical protein
VSPSLCIRGISGNGTFLADLSSRVERTTAALEAFDHATALAETERFFWSGLADNYLELVKTRLREGPDNNDGAASAANTLRVSLRVFLRLFAPFIAVRDRRDLVVVSRSRHRVPQHSQGSVAVAH